MCSVAETASAAMFSACLPLPVKLGVLLQGARTQGGRGENAATAGAGGAGDIEETEGATRKLCAAQHRACQEVH